MKQPAFFVYMHSRGDDLDREGVVLLDEIVAIEPMNTRGLSARIVLRGGYELEAVGDPSTLIRRWIDALMEATRMPFPGGKAGE